MVGREEVGPGGRDVFDDLRAEEQCIEGLLDGLGPEGWATPSLASGWTVCDVLLHLAQTEEAAAATVVRPVDVRERATAPRGVDAWAETSVQAERADGPAVLARWKRACDAFLAGAREADHDRLVQWVGGSFKPRTLATTRLAEHWAHGLDIAGGLGSPYPDTDRLRHIAWLGHRTLPYAFSLAGLEAQDVHCELRGPTGDVWRFGLPTAPSTISGDGGAFCRVGAQRLAPERSGLTATGPYGETALRLLRNYAA